MRLKRLYESSTIEEFIRNSQSQYAGRRTINDSNGEYAEITHIKPPTRHEDAELYYKFSNGRRDMWYIGCTSHFGLELANGTKYEWHEIHGATNYENLKKCYEELKILIENNFNEDTRTEEEKTFDTMVDELYPTI